MKKLLQNQWRLYWGALIYIKRLLGTSWRVGRDDFKEMKIRRQFGDNMLHDPLQKMQIIAQLADTPFSEEPVRITFAGAVRRFGNPNHNMERFLLSLLAHVKDASRVEVLVGIDEDDDIGYYLSLKNKYGSKLRLRIFISPIQFGYERLHLYDTVLLPHMAINSRMMSRYSDDCVITLKHFDEKLLEIDACYSDNIYFIQTRCTLREEFLGDVSKELLRLFWVFHTIHGCHSYFPIISRGVLKGAHEALQYLPESERAKWSPYANGAITDCYVDILATFLRAEGVDRICELDMIDLRHGIYVHYQHQRDEHGLTANDRFFITMLGQNTQAHLRQIAKTLAESVKAANLPLARLARK